jgi:DNA-binding transcriptional MerR regulator
MVATLTIGEFSQITHLSIKTLRRYHEGGLLAPAEVDPRTGYRYYTLDQVPTAQVIHRFRELDMPVREVAGLLAVSEPSARAALIAEHLARLESRLDQTRAAVVALRRLLVREPAPLDVRRRHRDPAVVAAIRDVVERRDVVGWYAAAMAELTGVLSSVDAEPTGPAGGLYDNELFTEDRGAVVVYMPVDDPPVRGAVEPFFIPATDLATAVHVGAHDDIDVTYGVLGVYVREHALQVAGPVQEIYHVGPRDTDESTAWRTEIGWPIFDTSGPRTAASSASN